MICSYIMWRHNHYLLAEIVRKVTKEHFHLCKKSPCVFLPNKNNLKFWGKSPFDQCNLCQQKQTQLHVLNNCPVSANSDRKLWRHNSILNTLHHCISQVDGFDIFVDLLGYENPADIFHDPVRPDSVLKRNGHIIVTELTYCFETNLVHSRNLKLKNIKILKYIVKLEPTKLKHFFSKCHHSVLLLKHLNP